MRQVGYSGGGKTLRSLPLLRFKESGRALRVFTGFGVTNASSLLSGGSLTGLDSGADSTFSDSSGFQ